jgi:hypothetical protein
LSRKSEGGADITAIAIIGTALIAIDSTVTATMDIGGIGAGTITTAVMATVTADASASAAFGFVTRVASGKGNAGFP